MRKWACLFYTGLLCLFVFSCSDDDNTSPRNTAEITSGSWHVALFKDSGNDETADFNGYSFTFAANGTATAISGGNSKHGTWSINSNVTRFNLDFGAKTDANKPLGELTDNWVVVSITTTEIKLEDDNSASEESLIFVQN
jgi:hypothetical protein